MEKPHTYPGRYLFLDNLRYLMVLFVVIFHASISYCTIAPWWGVVDPNRNELVNIFVLILNSFQIPVLFFISGFFVMPSIRKQGSGAFVISKFKRLGIPLILLGLFYTPVITYIRYALNTPDPLSYFSYWLIQMKSLSDFSVVHFPDKAAAMPYVNSLCQWHLWFISMLLVFCIIAAVGYQIKQILFPPGPATRSEDHPTMIPQGRGKILAMLGVFGVAIFLPTAVTNLYFFDWEWARVGCLLSYQPTRLPVYAGVFVMGIYAHERGWLLKPLPGKFWVWLIPVILFTFALLVAMILLLMNPTAIQPKVSIAIGGIRAFLVIFWICVFMNIGITRWNTQGSMGKLLTQCSYDIYLIHMPIVVLLQYAVLSLNASVPVKFGLVATLALGITISLTKLLVTPFPRWSAAGLVTGFMLATILIG
ncbi:MAG: acyltransferase [Desulfobacteraceae bacterium]|nr:acyltransferase [Desulfobacteraceae bacterium]